MPPHHQPGGEQARLARIHCAISDIEDGFISVSCVLEVAKYDCNEIGKTMHTINRHRHLVERTGRGCNETGDRAGHQRIVKFADLRSRRDHVERVKEVLCPSGN